MTYQMTRSPQNIIRFSEIPEFDNLYLDMNGIIHTCTHPNDDDVHFRMTEEAMFKSIFHYIEVLFRIIKPRKVFFMAVDGVAPRAKMNQQRGRRFRSAHEAEEREKEAVRKGEKLPEEKRFDSNCITPGTDFMVRLQQQLKYFVNMKITQDSKWQGIRIFLSGHETPGEGEHKIMDFIRTEKARKGYSPNTRHCLYGLDADLIMLGLISHEPHFSLLREEVRFGKQAKRPTTVEETTFHLLHLSLFREYLALEFSAIKDKMDWYDAECIIDDWVLLGFLVGNDFVPHLPDLHISHSALPLLYKTYIEVLPTLDGYINEGGHLNLARFEKFMKELSKFDYENFDNQAIDLSFLEGKQDENAWKSKRVEMKKAIRERLQEEMPGFMDMGWIENKDIDELSEEEEEEEDMDPIEMEFRMRKKDYYDNKMGFKNITKEQRAKIVSDYIHAIQWILHYYYNGIQSWSWYYPHHYSPYMSDLKDFADLPLTFDKGQPFLPFEQLLAVLPPASRDHLPQAYWPLMLNENSPIIEYYPLEFEQDLNGKLQAWEAVVLIPFIDENRLWAGMKMYEDKLTNDERKRNCHSEHLLYTTDLTKPHTYISSLQGKFPDIVNCVAQCELIRKDAFQIEISRLKKGLLEDVRLGVYFPGFPTLYHLDFEHKVRNADVKVFQQLSRGENCILSVNAKDTNPDARRLAKTLLGETVFAEWPHLKEVKVVAVSDGVFRYELVDDSRAGSMQEIKLKPQDAEKWKRDAKTIGEEYFRRKGVNIRETTVILYACPMLGRRYVCGVGGNITVEKQWTLAPIPYAYQVTLKDIAVHDPSFHQFKTLSELYPVDAPCFMLGNPHYGCQGQVQETNQERVQVLFTIPTEPNLDYIKASQNSHSVQYLESYVVAQRLGISSMQVSRLTGSVFVTRGPRPSRGDQGFRGSSVNVGLNLKFNKSEQEVPGFTRRNNEGKWIYSIQLMEILDAYLTEFPAVIQHLRGKGFNDSLFEDEMFAGVVYGLEEVKSWIDKQESTKAPKSKIGSKDLEAPVIKLIEEEIEKLKESPSKKKVKLSVRPHLLYRPMEGQGNLIADPDATYQLFDRVINVREGFTVPLGLRGVVTAIHTGNTVLDTTYDIVFDEEFPGALELRCTGKRGYRLNASALINISYGQSKVKGHQGHEKTMAVVKPQVKNVSDPGHTQSQEYYRNRMAQLGSAEAAGSPRPSQPGGMYKRPNQQVQQESFPSQVYSRTKVREDVGGSPISYAKATTNSSQAKATVPPVRQSSSAQQPKTGMQGLGKIPGGKADAKGERHQKGHRGSPVSEKKVTILKRNQDLGEVQDVAKAAGGRSDDTNQRRGGQGERLQKDDRTESVPPVVKKTVEVDQPPKHQGSPSARLPRLTKDKVPAEAEDVDELSSIWQKLMQVQDSPARVKDEDGDGQRTRKTTSTTEEDEEGPEDEEYVTSMGSQDEDEDAEEEDDVERMTPNTYRMTQTEQLCRLLNISSGNPTEEPAEKTNQTAGQESSTSSRVGYTKQVSVAELFESAKNTSAPPRSPISLPQGGPVVHSKPMGQVAPHPQSGPLMGPHPTGDKETFQKPPMSKQLFMVQAPTPIGPPVFQQQQQLPQPGMMKQPFMASSPSKLEQMDQGSITMHGTGSPMPPPPHRMQMSPQKPFMIPHMMPGEPVGYHQPPPPPMHGPQYTPPEYHQRGPHHRGPAPPRMPPGPPFMQPQGQDYYQGPPLMAIPPATEMLKGWCMAQKLPPPKFAFHKLPQGMVKAVCTLGTGISYDGPPCTTESMAIDRAAGVALHKLRIAPVHQLVRAPLHQPPSMMHPPNMKPNYRPKGMPQGYPQVSMAPAMMYPSQHQEPPVPGIFVPLQVTKQLATSVSKPNIPDGTQPGTDPHVSAPVPGMEHPRTYPSHPHPSGIPKEAQLQSDPTVPMSVQGIPVQAQTRTELSQYPYPSPHELKQAVDTASGSSRLPDVTQTNGQGTLGDQTHLQPETTTPVTLGGTEETGQSPASKVGAPSRSKRSRAKLAISFSAGK
ncbi:5'-3' exoribonuclease 1-like [Lytechinus pictus]|uniref:5'-3' exoribonuclease 1-like n=1 Tax=Lytechinus pictus TaxID=7653 RepID=UPI0030B9ED33